MVLLYDGEAGRFTMKLSSIISCLLSMVLFCSGCVCTKVGEKAHEHPAYALLYPVALPADIVASPAYGIILLYVMSTGAPKGDGAVP
jgi:formate hydrogenlyase subunit 3/multisubunit Na+/H+ antiporter MnhD subunit